MWKLRATDRKLAGIHRLWLGLLFLSFGLSGCVQQVETLPDPVVANEPEPEVLVLPLLDRWSAIWSQKDGIDPLLARVRGKSVRRIAQRSVQNNLTPTAAVANLKRAVRHTNNAKSQIQRMHKYRQRGGVSLQTSWGIGLWKRVSEQLGTPDTDQDLSRMDLIAARQSMAAQAAKGWFYLVAIRQHRLRAEERLQIHKQMHTRAATGLTLGRITQMEVDQVQAGGQAMRHYLKQIRAAEKSAGLALAALTGLSLDQLPVVAGIERVLQMEAAVPLSMLTQRPDLQAAEARLISSFSQSPSSAQIVLPDIPVTSKYAKPTRQFSKLLTSHSGMLDAGYPLLHGVEPVSEPQQQALTDYDLVLWNSMQELKQLLRDGRSLQNQYVKRKGLRKQADSTLNDVRARYNAGRTNLSDVLQQQLSVLEVDSEKGYVLYRMYEQRIDSYLASGIFTSVAQEPGKY